MNALIEKILILSRGIESKILFNYATVLKSISKVLRCDRGVIVVS